MKVNKKTKKETFLSRKKSFFRIKKIIQNRGKQKNKVNKRFFFFRSGIVKVWGCGCFSHLSHCRSVQLAIIHSETMNTSSTVPGQIVMRVLSTKRVLKLIRLRAPMLLELASVNSLEWSSITLAGEEKETNVRVEGGREEEKKSRLVNNFAQAQRMYYMQCILNIILVFNKNSPRGLQGDSAPKMHKLLDGNPSLVALLRGGSRGGCFLSERLRKQDFSLLLPNEKKTQETQPPPGNTAQGCVLQYST